MHSVSHLAADFLMFALGAASALCDDRIAVGYPQGSCRHNPWLEEDLRILDRHFVKHLVPGPGELLDDAHLIGVEEAATSEPRLVGEPDGVEDVPLATRRRRIP